MRVLSFLIMLAAIALLRAAVANDSEAAVAIGGLVLKKNDVIVMESEDLFISPDEVRVAYVYRNRGRAPLTLTIAFPLPPVDFSKEDEGRVIDRPEETLDFKTTVDGKPVSFRRDVRATLDGRDVTARLLAAGLPLDRSDDIFRAAVDRLAPAERARLIADKLIDDSSRGANDRVLHAPRWTYVLSLVREQTFAPDRPVRVEHRYRPVAGGSVAGSIELLARGTDKALTAEYRRTYCTDADFIKGLARKMAKKKVSFREIFLRYVLKTGANWSGPIRDFRLVIDKGKPERFLSLCGSGLRKVSPTAFEMRRKNFTPTQDLEILIVGTADED
jgi:hypothetical protein